jgi:hypothetical protein
MFMWTGPRYRELFPSRFNPFFADIKDNVARRAESFAAQATLPEPPDGELAGEPANPAVVTSQ